MSRKSKSGKYNYRKRKKNNTYLSVLIDIKILVPNTVNVHMKCMKICEISRIDSMSSVFDASQGLWRDTSATKNSAQLKSLNKCGVCCIFHVK